MNRTNDDYIELMSMWTTTTTTKGTQSQWGLAIEK